MSDSISKNWKVINFCAGCTKGNCFPYGQGEQVWKHLKAYRGKQGYKHVTMVHAQCLRMCHFAGPNILLIDAHGPTEYHLGARNITEGKERIDRFMDEHVIDCTPP